MNPTILSALITSVVPALMVAYTVRTSRRSGDRQQAFAEVQALEKKVASLERRVLSATAYIDICMDDYRSRGREPPPVPNRAPAPWEE